MKRLLALGSLLLGLAAPPAFAGDDADADRDGLSDFHERVKHGTDPARADTDGDGIPDGDWEERREHAYTVKTIVRVMPPVTDDVLSDDWQDARILGSGEEHVTLEVVHYPFGTAGEAIVGDPDWRRTTRGMREWTRPGPTANWDEPMRERIVAGLREAGIDAATLDDKTLVERAVPWLLDRALEVDGFTTFCFDADAEGVRIHPGLEATVEQEAAGREPAEVAEGELLARGMFERGTRGSCTSTAIYLNGCLRALGIPTRVVLVIPAIDASDPAEVAMLRRLSHHRVRKTMEEAAATIGQAWASHTMNEVWVGGRCRRLNYQRLGQGILDPHLFGLVTHVATFSDWADGRMAATWGTRQSLRRFSADAFGGANPYSTLEVWDRFGPHASVPNEPAPGLDSLVIERAYWWDDPARHEAVTMRLDDPETAGHVLVHVRDVGEDGGALRSFYARVPKEFTLVADGHAAIPIRATRGFWTKSAVDVREFYLRIEPADLQRMPTGVAFRLVPPPAADGPRWEVTGEVTLTR
jgi:hypothetical protein